MRIRTKILFYTLLPILILLPIITFYSSQQVKTTEWQRLNDKIERTNEQIKLMNAEPLYKHQRTNVLANCNTLFKDDEIIKIAVQDTTVNNVFANLTDEAKLNDRHQKITHQLNIEKDKRYFGTIQVVYTSERIDKLVAKTRNSMLLLSLLLLAAFGLIYFLISNILSKPIKTVVESLKIVDSGDLNHQLQLQNEDEFKEIQNHFNKMVTSIRTSKETIEKANQQLVLEVDERKRTAKLLSNVITHIPYSVFWKNKDLEYAGFNQNFIRDAQINPDNLIGKTDADVIQDPQLKEWYETIDGQVINDKKAFLEMEHAQMKDGKEVFYSTSKVPLYNQAGEVVGLLGIYSDISERKRKEKELKNAKEAAEAANIAKSEFLANMSHEIRTPMNGIMGVADIMMHTNLTKDQQKYVSLIKTSSDSLLHVINDILDISKIEAGKLELKESDFDLEDVVIKTVDSFAVMSHEKQIELMYHIAPDVNTQLIGDSDKLKRVLINVIGNALKFTKEGAVSLLVENVATDKTDSTRLKFSITDTGIGIPAGKLESVFDSFSQVEASYNRRYNGTGLGLAISKSLIQMMHGDIHVNSKLGEGSTFYFDALFKHTEVKYPSYTHLYTQMKALKVLVVEDNQQNADILQKLLHVMGSEVTLVSSVKDATKALEKSIATATPEYDIILLDMHLGEESGIEVIEHIKHQLSLISSVVMMVNSVDAKNSKDALFKCKSIGVGVFLVKPVKPGELQEAFLATLKRQRQIIPMQSLNGNAVNNSNKNHKNGVAHNGSKNGTIVKSKGGKVLVAEDHEINQKITSIMLKKIGYETVIASNGQDAVDMFNDTYSLILMDIQMPDIDGIEATRLIRTKNGGNDIPIIALTAHAQAGDRERFINAGMTDYISKPYEAKEFYRIIGKYLEAVAS